MNGCPEICDVYFSLWKTSRPLARGSGRLWRLMQDPSWKTSKDICFEPGCDLIKIEVTVHYCRGKRATKWIYRMQGLARRETKRILSHVPVVLSGVFAWHCRFLPFVTCKPVLVLWLCQSAVATVQCSFLSLCCHIVIRCAATDCENKQGWKEREKIF